MATYVKLGSKAESFYDPYSTLKVVGKDVVVLTPKMQMSERVKAALAGGHLTLASETEFKLFTGVIENEEEKIESKFGSTNEELIKFYTDTYDVSAKDLKAFKKMAIKAKVDELTRLEADNE